MTLLYSTSLVEKYFRMLFVSCSRSNYRQSVTITSFHIDVDVRWQQRQWACAIPD